MARPSAPKTGAMMKAYYSTTLDPLTGVNVLLGEVGDVTVSGLGREGVELKYRGSGYIKELPGLKSLREVELEVIYGMNPTLDKFLEEAMEDAEIFLLKIMDGDITESGSAGLVMPVFIKEMDWKQSISEVSSRTVKCVNTYAVNDGEELNPQWLEIA